MARVGIDTGGTYTDFVYFDGRSLHVHKEPSTPHDPSAAILNGLQYLSARFAGGVTADVIHGSTVGTNALLERKGARTALVTTRGFEDVLEIGRQTRRAIYDINVDKPSPLVPGERRLGVAERIGPHGETIVALTEDELQSILSRIRALGPESIAICLLHSYANPDHEGRIAALLRAESGEWFVSASCEIVPEFREYERCSTAVINAYVGPVMQKYLGKLESALGERRVAIMQSNGGVMSVAAARRLAVHTVLSGPAGGAVGGFEAGKSAGFANVISFDMGGTSTDVSLAEGRLGLTSEGSIGELPIRVPILDIHTVGAGGGSIASRDPGGSLRVGPRSAGAQPGPVCYGRGGTEVTVTDANLFLGRLSPDHFLGGAQKLETAATRDAIAMFAKSMALSPAQAAEGIIQVANATMERAIRVISLERGHDPRDFALVCFGGAGGMHAADLARALGIPIVIVPPAAGTLSALGMLQADFVRDYSRTLLARVEDGIDARLSQAFDELDKLAREDCGAEGIAFDGLWLARSLDMRYAGQGYELQVPMDAHFAQEFNRLHEQRYGYSDPTRTLEIVNVRLRAAGESAAPERVSQPSEGRDATAARIGDTRMTFDSREMAASLIDRDRMRPGNVVAGPALIVEYSTTTVVPPDYEASMDGSENLLLRIRDA